MILWKANIIVDVTQFGYWDESFERWSEVKQKIPPRDISCSSDLPSPVPCVGHLQLRDTFHWLGGVNIRFDAYHSSNAMPGKAAGILVNFPVLKPEAYCGVSRQGESLFQYAISESDQKNTERQRCSENGIESLYPYQPVKMSSLDN
jgi:hypothetical protein